MCPKLLDQNKKAIWQALKNLGVTYKKNPASSQGRRRDTARLPGHDSLL
ncbi:MULTISPECIES: hypothetical protein [Candidatus Fukatsuia]|nr:hypothetical protein [Candidatus Fukatsuia symbiotica]